MGLRVNTNIASLNAQRNLFNSSTALAALAGDDEVATAVVIEGAAALGVATPPLAAASRALKAAIDVSLTKEAFGDATGTGTGGGCGGEGCRGARRNRRGAGGRAGGGG